MLVVCLHYVVIVGLSVVSFQTAFIAHN